MAVLSVEAFADRFRSLSAADRRAFLAALWRARGYSVTVDSRELVIESGEMSHRVAVVGRYPYGATDAAVLVGTVDSDRARRYADRQGATFLSPADIRDVLLYDLDRATANRLAESHLGGSLESIEAAARDDGRSTVLVGLVLGILLFGALGLLVGGISFTDGSADDAGLVGDPSTPPLEMDYADSSHDGFIEHDPPSSGFEPHYPDGLSADGLEDVDALVAEHRHEIADRPHRLSLRYEGPPADPLYPETGVYAFTKVRGVDAYQMVGTWSDRSTETNRSTVTVYGEYRGPEFRVNWRQRNDEIVLFENARYVEHPFDPRGPHDPIDLYRASLESADISVETIQRAGDLQHRIEMTGEPTAEQFAGATDFHAVAVLTQSGRIVELSIRYTHRETGEPVLVRIAYTGVGSITTVGLDPTVAEAVSDDVSVDVGETSTEPAHPLRDGR